MKALVFDAYGTILDVNSIDDLLTVHFGDKGIVLGKLWRQKQLEYSWLRQIMGKYIPFSSVTKDALIYSLESLDLVRENGVVSALMAEYDQLKAYPDVQEILTYLKGKYKLSILSNADHGMLYDAISYNNLANYFDHLLSAHSLEKFKPDPKVYQYAEEMLGFSKKEIIFISSNSWDVSGAKAFGFNVYWINRKNLPSEHLGLKPDGILTKLDHIKNLV